MAKFQFCMLRQQKTAELGMLVPGIAYTAPEQREKETGEQALEREHARAKIDDLIEKEFAKKLSPSAAKKYAKAFHVQLTLGAAPIDASEGEEK